MIENILKGAAIIVIIGLSAMNNYQIQKLEQTMRDTQVIIMIENQPIGIPVFKMDGEYET